MASASIVRSPSPRRSRACRRSLREVGGRALRGGPLGICPMLFDEVGLQRGRELVDRLERLVEGSIAGVFVNHGASVPRRRLPSLARSAEPARHHSAACISSTMRYLAPRLRRGAESDGRDCGAAKGRPSRWCALKAVIDGRSTQSIPPGAGTEAWPVPILVNAPRHRRSAERNVPPAARHYPGSVPGPTISHAEQQGRRSPSRASAATVLVVNCRYLVMLADDSCRLGTAPPTSATGSSVRVRCRTGSPNSPMQRGERAFECRRCAGASISGRSTGLGCDHVERLR